MLGYYLTRHPAIYDTIMDMIDEYRAVVNEYNKSVGLKDIAARMVRPDDQVIGAAPEVYSATYVDAGDRTLLNVAAAARVPAGQGVLHLGWHSQGDLGGDGILQVDLENIKRQEICAQWAYNGEFHNYIEPQQIIFARQGDLIHWIIHPVLGLNPTCVVFPVAFLIGPRKQLLV
nr:MAG: hypothetical protein [uncultured archaeon]